MQLPINTEMVVSTKLVKKIAGLSTVNQQMFAAIIIVHVFENQTFLLAVNYCDLQPQGFPRLQNSPILLTPEHLLI